MKNIILLLVIIALCTGCADSVTFDQASEMSKVGFWHGLWHGICFPFSLVGSWFMDDVAIYAIYNNGGWYDFGFYIGTASLVGGASNNG